MTTGVLTGQPRAGFRDVLRQRSFLVPYLAETQSIIGDQLGRVALSVLVFQRTNSAAATALTYAATFLPAILGGWLLGPLGDRFSQRAVMVCCDALRAALFAAMAIPGLPLVGVIALLVAAVVVGPAVTSAEIAYLADALDGEHLRMGSGLRLISSQIAQVAGFAVGGLVVAFLRPRGALLLDAASFAVAALVIGVALPVLHRARHRPSGETGTAPPSAAPLSRFGRRRLIWQDVQLRNLVALSWLAAFFVVPEGLAVPVAHAAGGNARQAGLLLAAIPLGGALGAVVLLRFAPVTQRRLAATVMAVLAGVPLVLTPWLPDWRIVTLAWFVSGALAAYQVEVGPRIAHAAPAGYRAQVMGLLGAGFLAVQGVGLAVFGGVAQGVGSSAAVSLAGIVGVVLAVVVVLAGRAPSSSASRRVVPE